MDDAGIDLQVISENNPATQNLDAETAVKLARASNDALHEAVRAHPGRFAGFATLPTPDPKAAADELERAVSKLGFKGAMIMGLTHGRFMDDKKFRPIFVRAAALDVPVYIHPTPPHPAVMDAYFKDYPVLSGAPLGFTLETLTHTYRLILSGLFDDFPSLKIIVGHLGETAPFLLWRTRHAGPAHQNAARVRRLLPDAFLAYHQRRFFRCRARLLDRRDERRAHYVFDRLAVPGKPARPKMAGRRAGERARPRDDFRRQRAKAAQAVTARGLRRRLRRPLPQLASHRACRL
jgi:predicted TIM-barrel fold metal-dependent hydrolase